MRIEMIEKRVNNTELNKGGMKDSYLSIPKKSTINNFLEIGKEYVFIDKNDNEKFKITYKLQKNGENRIAGLGRFYRKYELDAGDSVILEKLIDNNGEYGLFLGYKKYDNIAVFQKGGKIGFECLKGNLLDGIKKSENLGNIKISYKGKGKKRKKSKNDTKYYLIKVDNKNIFEKYAKDDMLEIVLCDNYYTMKKITKLKYIAYDETEIDEQNNKKDMKLVSSLKEENFLDNIVEYHAKPEKKTEAKAEKLRSIYPRDKNRAINALKRADFKCEVDINHKTFKRRGKKIDYTEPHHLIPLKFFNEFENSLDVEANIVSLCSHCHNLVHYGDGAEEIIEFLWKERKNELKSAGIEIELDNLKCYYNL